MKKPNTVNAYAGLGDVLGSGFGDLMAVNEGDQLVLVDLKDITVEAQVREEFEDEENSNDEMDASVREHGVLQSILIRPVENGPRPYVLVAGERRYQSSVRTGKIHIPALIRQLTDEQASDIQLAENIQRKNLTQIELAKRIQKDLDTLGSVDAVLAKHQKGRAWLSKILSLLKLPAQTKRLVSEKISADLEVINKVKTIEKIDPQAAKALVDDLKKSRGKEDARKKADAIKDKVKPSAKKPKGIAAVTLNETDEDLSQSSNQNFADANAGPDSESWPFKSKDGDQANNRPDIERSTGHTEALNNAYSLIFESGSSPKMILDSMEKQVRVDVELWLRTFYDAGKQSKDTGRAAIQGFRSGTFASDGAAAFALISFLHGADSEVKFNMLNILAGVKE